MKKVAVIMGSDSDWPVVKNACRELEKFGVPYEAHILSAHRTPAQAAEFVKEKGLQEQVFFNTVEELIAAKAEEQRMYMKKR